LSSARSRGWRNAGASGKVTATFNASDIAAGPDMSVGGADVAAIGIAAHLAGGEFEREAVLVAAEGVFLVPVQLPIVDV
jgi:hypothetical protein